MKERIEEDIKRIESALHDKGITPYKLSKELGVSPATVSNWLRRLKSPRPYHLKRARDFLGIE